MQALYELVPDNDSLEKKCTFEKFQTCLMFFQPKPLVLTENYFNHEMGRLQTLQFSDDKHLTREVLDLIQIVKRLKSQINNQQDLDNIAGVLCQTTRYLSKEMENMTEFQTELQQYSVTVQPHRNFSYVGYATAAAIGIGALVLLSMPYVAIALALSGMIAALTYRHAHDPYRIIGDKLATITAGREGQFDRPIPSKNDIDGLSYSYGL